MKRALTVLLVSAILSGSISLAEAETATHVISGLSFEIKGLTRERSLRSFLCLNPPLREGVELPTAEALTGLLQRKRQDLLNRRVFKSVEIRDVEGVTENGRTEHVVTVAVVDSFTIFPLPYASYDSNSGLEIGVETKYDNGLGTMTNWYLDMYMVMRERDEAFGIGPWKIHPRISYLVIGGLPFTLDAAIQRDESSRIDLGVLVEDWACYKVNANLGTTVGFANDWYLKPKLDATTRFGFRDYLETGDGFDRDVFAATLSASVGRGRVNWVGNLRSGADASLSASVSALDRNDVFGVAGEIGGTATWYLPWRILNYYGRVHAQYSINGESGGLGSWLRGIRNSSMGGVAGAFLNQTLAIDALHWKGVFDLQIHPFLDAGIVMPGSRAFVLASDVRVGTGLDAALFVDVISNFLIRCSVGIDVTSSDPFDDIELVLNTSMYY